MIHIPHREDNAFSIVFLITLVIPLIFVPIFPEAYETVKYPLLLLLTGVGILILLSRKEVQFHKSSLFVLVGLILLHVISTLFSLDFTNSLVGIYGRYAGSLIFVVAWSALIFLVWNAVKQDEQRRVSLMRVLFFDAFLISILGIFQYFDFVYYGGNKETARLIIPSFIGNQNFYAMFLVAVLPSAMVLWNYVSSKWTKHYLIVASFIIVWAIILSGSRGGILGLAVALIVLLFIAFIRKYPRQYWLGVVGIIGMAALLYSGFFATTRIDTTSGITNNAQYTTQARYVLWSNALTMIKNYPLLGTGPVNFFISFQMIADPNLTSNERFDDAHNLPLNMAATVGVPALLSFLSLLLIAGLVAWRESDFKKGTAIWLLSGTSGLVVATMFNPVSVSIWALMAILLGLATSYVTVSRVVNQKIKVAAGLLAVLLIVFSVGFMLGEIFNKYGVSAYHKKENDKAESLFKKAVIANPFNANTRFYLIASQINQKSDLEQSSREIEKVIGSHQFSSQTYKTAADLYYRIYSFTGEEKYKNRMNELYEKSISLESNSAQLYGSAAYAFYKTNQSDKALEFLDRQLALPDTTDYPYSWVVKAKIYSERNQKAEAIDAMERAYSGLPDQPVLKYYIFQLKNSEEVSKIPFPVLLPDLDI